jgi:hypothetical protein
MTSILKNNSESNTEALGTILSEGYNKCHRDYIIVSALLLAWEIIGITVDKQPFRNYNFSFKNPQAFPAVLFVLIFYFMFKMTIEWHLNNKVQRNSIPAKIDFYSAHVIAFSSLFLYSYQQATTNQLITLLPTDIAIRTILVFISIVASIISALKLHDLLVFWTNPVIKKEYTSRIKLFSEMITPSIINIVFIYILSKIIGPTYTDLFYNGTMYLLYSCLITYSLAISIYGYELFFIFKNNELGQDI